MNKILVSDSIDLSNDLYILNCKNKDLELNIDGNVTVYLINETLNKINIMLKDDSLLTLYKFNNKKCDDLEINVYQNNNSTFNYNDSFINEVNSSLKINNYIKGNNNNSSLKIRNICNKLESKIIINVEINKNTINNNAIEDLKGINNGGIVHIEPNIVCESNEVMANHLTTIGPIDKSSVNYLISKGINKKDSEKILLKGFLYSIMDDCVKNDIGGE